MQDLSAIDRPEFLKWLDEHRPQLGSGPLEHTRLTGGTSMTILKISRGGESAVLRMPIIPPRADSVRAIDREGQLLNAIRGSAIPHARLYEYCKDESVIGAPFLMMEFVDGWLNAGEKRNAPPPYDKPGPHQRDLAFAMIDAIATIRTVDYKAVGLEEFGKPEGFLTRQVPRYLKQIESYKVTENHPGREIPGMDYVTDWLQANTPEMSAVTIIHGDTGFPNLLFSRTNPAKVAALIDWEMATLGDPLLDLARAIMGFPSELVKNQVSNNPDPNAPTIEELSAYYAKISGADVSRIHYYVVLARFRLAAIIEWNYARYINGKDPTGQHKYVADLVLGMIAGAEEMARGSSAWAG